jgi:uncharacterized UBP type Zn finger protein
MGKKQCEEDHSKLIDDKKPFKKSKSSPVSLQEKAITRKSGIINIGNSCYMSSVFQAVAHLNIHSTRKVGCELSSFLRTLSTGQKNLICPKNAIYEIKNLWDHQNIQEDAFEFFMTILPMMQSEKFTFEYQCKRICELCQYSSPAVARKDCSVMMSLNGKSLQEQLDLTLDPIDEICSNCGKGFLMLCRSLMKAPKILTVRIMRFAINSRGKPSKIWNKVALPDTIYINKKAFLLEAVILHRSKALHHGHYTIYFPRSKVLVDDEKVVFNKTLKLDYSYFYIAFYK